MTRNQGAIRRAGTKDTRWTCFDAPMHDGATSPGGAV
jgi:hypothetical protein